MVLGGADYRRCLGHEGSWDQYLMKESPRTSLMVQWLRLHASSAGGWGSIPDRGAGSHMPRAKIPQTSTRIEDTVCLTKTNCSQTEEKTREMNTFIAMWGRSKQTAVCGSESDPHLTLNLPPRPDHTLPSSRLSDSQTYLDDGMDHIITTRFLRRHPNQPVSTVQRTRPLSSLCNQLIIKKRT